MEEVAGRFPWPREVYGQLIDGLAPQRPRAIVFDILFSEKDIARPESDQEFVGAARRDQYLIAAVTSAQLELQRLFP